MQLNSMFYQRSWSRDFDLKKEWRKSQSYIWCLEWSEVWPSRGIHLRRVKQVHSCLISYGHQVLSHLGEHKNWDWHNGQIPITQRSFVKDSMQGGLYSEDTDNISPSQYSFKATGLKDFIKRTKNTEICAHSTIVFHKSVKVLRSSLFIQTERWQSSHLIRDLWSKSHPGAWTRGETEVFGCFFWGVENEWDECFPAFELTHLTRGRKHVGLTSRGSCE